MILNQIDLQVLRTFRNIKEGEDLSPWTIMKKIYPNGRTSEYMRVMRRIKKMCKYGLFVYNGTENCPRYILITDYVKIKKFQFPDRKSLGVAFKINNMWQVVEY